MSRIDTVKTPRATAPGDLPKRIVMDDEFSARAMLPRDLRAAGDSR
jgi:hypothetical protein